MQLTYLLYRTPGHGEGTTHLTKTAQPIRGAGVEIQPKPGYHTLDDLVIVAEIKGVPRNSHSLEIIGFEEKLDQPL